MTYYFVSPDGDILETEENVKGWFSKDLNPNMFTQRRQAVAEQKRRMKVRIAELQQLIKELK